MASGVISRRLDSLISKLGLGICLDRGVSYTPIKQLGEGGFGKVFLAQDNRTGQKLAVKQIGVQIHQLKEELPFLENEIAHLSAATAAMPEYVCQLVCVSRSDIYLEVIMQYCGTNLFDIMEDAFTGKTAIPPLPIVLTWLQNCCRALYILNEQLNILHLDIKPENILIRDNLNIAIVDFGLSAFLPDYNKYPASKVYRGTEGYIAPEILNGTGVGKFTSKVDVYSLGKTFELFKRKYPQLTPIINGMIEHNPDHRLSFEQVMREILLL